MGGKLFLALQLEVAHHFIERCAGERTRRSEPPATYGATKTPKMLLLNPYQLPAHGRLCRCTPTSTRLLSGDETFWFAINGSFRSGVLPDCSRKPYPVWACRKMHKKMHKKMGEVYMRQFWMVCRTSYIHGKVLFVRTADFGGLVGSERNRFKWWSRFVRLEAVSIAQYQGRIQHSVARSSRGGSPCPTRLPVSHPITGEFIPSLASGRISQGSKSATKYCYRSPIASTVHCVLISNTSACQTISSFTSRVESWNLRISRI